MKEYRPENRPSDAENDLLVQLKHWDSIVFDNEELFIQHFCPSAEILYGVYWGPERMKISFIIESGKHISDSIHIDEWLRFLETNASVEASPTKDHE